MCGSEIVLPLKHFVELGKHNPRETDGRKPTKALGAMFRIKLIVAPGPSSILSH